MRIESFIWPEERIEHIARHGVTPDEVEEACFGRSLLQRGKSEGENPVYYVLGQTGAGRYWVQEKLARRNRARQTRPAT